MKSEILHGELPVIIQRIHTLYNNFQAQRSLFGKRIGVIGTPSSWLVASNVDYLWQNVAGVLNIWIFHWNGFMNISNK